MYIAVPSRFVVVVVVVFFCALYSIMVRYGSVSWYGMAKAVFNDT